MALQNDGTVRVWGEDLAGQRDNIPDGLNNVVSIAAGENHGMALQNDGTVVVWGDGAAGQRDNIPDNLNNGTVVSIAAGGRHSMALKNDGTVVAWGRNSWDQLAVLAGLTDVVSIAAGYDHSMALKNDGTVIVWGSDVSGQRNVPAGLNNVVAIAAGGGHSMALQNDGFVRVWGNNISGQRDNIPDGLNNVVSIAAGWYHSMALQNDGTVRVWGITDEDQRDVPAGLNNVVSIATGYGHSMALQNDGTVRVWADYDQLQQPRVPDGLIARVAAAHSLQEINPENIKLGSPFELTQEEIFDTINSLLSAINRNSKEEIEQIVNRIKTDHNITALGFASFTGHVEVVKYLVENGHDINASDHEGTTALHTASGNGHMKVVKYLVENGSNINAVESLGTVLHAALLNPDNSKVDIVKYLIENGANSTRDIFNVIDDIDLKNEFIELAESKISWHEQAEMELNDPITMELFEDPLIASDGHTYSRSSLQTLFNRGNPLNPLTRESLVRLNGLIGIPNIYIKKMVDKYEAFKLKISLGGYKPLN